MLQRLGLGHGATVDVAFPEKAQKAVQVKGESGKPESVPVFASGDALSGEVVVTPPPGRKVEHGGIRVELLGQMELYGDRGSSSDFLSLARELEPPGEITEASHLPFDFGVPELQYESYLGINAKVRYLLRVTVTKQYQSNVVRSFRFLVHNPSFEPELNRSIKMDVGIEDCLHIEFEYEKSAFHLTDVVVGRIYFILTRIKIKTMELEIRRRETTGSGANTMNESETIAKYEVMDGSPVRGEIIPVRLHLAPYELTPTHNNVNNKFSVRYNLNLVLVDEEDRRYFKQQEILLYRAPEEDSEKIDTYHAASLAAPDFSNGNSNGDVEERR
jgi:vacuolar protein sorting-associated protein 26